MKHEDWKEQIKWGITAFSVLAAVSLVYVLVNNFYAVKQNLAVFLQILMPIIYGAVSWGKKHLNVSWDFLVQ